MVVKEYCVPKFNESIMVEHINEEWEHNINSVPCVPKFNESIMVEHINA